MECHYNIFKITLYVFKITWCVCVCVHLCGMVCMCVCTCVAWCVCVCAHLCGMVCMYVCVHLCGMVCVHLCGMVCVCVYTCVAWCVCVCVYTCVAWCVYVCVCTLVWHGVCVCKSEDNLTGTGSLLLPHHLVTTWGPGTKLRRSSLATSTTFALNLPFALNLLAVFKNIYLFIICKYTVAVFRYSRRGSQISLQMVRWLWVTMLGFELQTFGRAVGCSYPLSHLTSPGSLFLLWHFRSGFLLGLQELL